jgi:predicted metal-dependent hydrolase
MSTQHLNISGISMEVEFKDIKNIHLSVYPPTGRVRIAAPAWVSLEIIRLYAIAKLDWIKKQQKKLQGQERETPREYIDRESHYVWGKRYLLKIIEADRTPTVELKHNQMMLTVRAGAEREKKEDVVASWYREQLRVAMSPLIAKWEALMGVKANRVFVQRMKTKWGSCNPHTRSFRLNSELARKSPECLEYVIVHELVHLIEPTHNKKFVALMDQFMPQWRQFRDELNRMPLSHVDWEY